MPIWSLRILWLSLPFTAAPAVRDATGDWSDATRVVAAVLLWIAWGVGLTSVLAPRPLAQTAARTLAPLFVVVAASSAVSASIPLVLLALVVTVACWVLVASPTFGLACAAGVAYGTELRYPLKVPPALLMAPIPFAVLLLGAGVAAGPLLLADGQPVVGGIALVVGLAVVVLVARSLHALSKRWAILVPAGLVVVDQMTLADPVLFTLEDTARLELAPREPPPEPEAVDVRLGAVVTSLAIDTWEPVPVARTLNGRRGARVVMTKRTLFAPVRPRALLVAAAGRHIPAILADAD